MNRDTSTTPHSGDSCNESRERNTSIQQKRDAAQANLEMDCGPAAVRQEPPDARMRATGRRSAG
jgi:hypothetical protein